jgi:hypothetical protein
MLGPSVLTLFVILTHMQNLATRQNRKGEKILVMYCNYCNHEKAQQQMCGTGYMEDNNMRWWKEQQILPFPCIYTSQFE